MRGAEQIRSHSGLRGIAALLVVAYHLQFSAPRLPLEDATAFFRRGYLFVDLFFMLSGFILSYTNDADRPRPLTWAHYKDFMGRRFVRLYPLLLFTLAYLVLLRGLITLAYHAAGRPGPFPGVGDTLPLLVAQATLLNVWMPDPGGWNLPSWSISAEMFAYVLFLPLVALHARRSYAATVALAAIAIGFYGWIATHGGSLDMIGGLAPLRCLAGFVLGMLLFFRRGVFARLSDAVLTVMQVAIVAVIVVSLMFPVNDVAIVIPFALLVGSSWRDRGMIAQALGRPWLLHLGTISYSVYLNHACLMQLMEVPWDIALRHAALDPILIRGMMIATTFGIVLAVSHVTYHRVEVPGRRWLAWRLLGHPLRAIEQSPSAP